MTNESTALLQAQLSTANEFNTQLCADLQASRHSNANLQEQLRLANEALHNQTQASLPRSAFNTLRATLAARDAELVTHGSDQLALRRKNDDLQNQVDALRARVPNPGAAHPSSAEQVQTPQARVQNLEKRNSSHHGHSSSQHPQATQQPPEQSSSYKKPKREESEEQHTQSRERNEVSHSIVQIDLTNDSEDLTAGYGHPVLQTSLEAIGTESRASETRHSAPSRKHRMEDVSNSRRSPSPAQSLASASPTALGIPSISISIPRTAAVQLRLADYPGGPADPTLPAVVRDTIIPLVGSMRSYSNTIRSSNTFRSVASRKRRVSMLALAARLAGALVSHAFSGGLPSKQ